MSSIHETNGDPPNRHPTRGQVLQCNILNPQVLERWIARPDPGKVPAGRALLRRLSGATARGPNPRLVALAASPPASPVAPGRTRQARFYPAPRALLTRGEKLARLRGRKETAAGSVPGAGGIDIDSS